MSSIDNAQRWHSDVLEQKTAGDRINQLREQIDLIDEDIARLLVERFSIARQIGGLKAEARIPVLDNSREKEVLRRAYAAAKDPIDGESIEEVFRVVMQQSRKLQTSAQPKGDQSRLTFPCVLVIGVGLIGGTLARQIKSIMPATRILGCDQPDKLQPALEAGVIDGGDADFTNLVKKASLIVLAANPEVNLLLLCELAPHVKQGQLIIDVTSSKQAICALAESLEFNGAEFIGGHPLMGSEKQGFAASTEVKVDGSNFCLSPTTKSSEVSIGRVSRWLSDLNFNVQLLDAETHDAVVSQVSHLVQLVATAMGASLNESLSANEIQTALKLGGRTFQENRRLMNSPADMWFGIAQQNKQVLLESLDCLRAKLMSISEAVDRGDPDAFGILFAKAKTFAQAL